MFHDKYTEIKTRMKDCNIQKNMFKKMIIVKLILILTSPYQM
jgi:hypothetical protein